MMKKQSGFTLIELIVVIVILGILAATALPRFLSVSNDARRSVVRGVEGSMRAANAMVYAKAAIYGQLGATGTLTPAQLGIQGGGPFTLTWGYANNATNLRRVMDLSPATDFNVTAGAIQHARAVNPATCQVAYTPATGVNAPPTYTLSNNGALNGC